VPWPLWVGLITALLLMGFVFWHVAGWLSGYTRRSGAPEWYLPVSGLLLLAAAQVAFYQARAVDRRWWRLKRAPELKLRQVHSGDIAWLHGKPESDSPLFAPFVNQPCVYYRLVLRTRDSDQAGWRTARRETRAVDFTLVQDGGSVYIPSGNVLFDAGIYVDSLVDPSGTQHARVWALPVGLPVSVCGKMASQSSQRRMDAPGDGVPVVVTWHSPATYVRLLTRRVTIARSFGWLVSVMAVLLFIAGAAQA
jgi:hypothetical protein